MLKAHVVHGGGHGYYLEGRERGTDLEAPGVWTGPASVVLGLTGEVDGQAFAALMEGRHPVTGDRLRRTVPNAVEAVDLTFCAPKSVSLLHALAPAEVAGAAGAGHRRAVQDATGYLSRHGIGVRRAAGGAVRFLPSTGMVAGAFTHQMSRALDPHLHTHVVAANVARGPDGRWSAVDGRRLFVHLQSAGAVYHASLRLDLTRHLGVAWEVRPSGFGDVVGVDPVLRRLYSQRTAAIDEWVTTRAGDRGVGRRAVSAATRPEKDLSVSLGEMRQAWRDRAADVGLDLGELHRVVGRGRAHHPPWPPGGPDPGRLATRLETDRRSGAGLARRDLVAEVAASAIGGADAVAIEEVVDRIVAAVEPDRTLTRAREPRWPTAAVADLARRHGPELLPDPGPAARYRGPAPAREPGLDRDPVRGRDPRPDRDLRRGPGLGW